LGLSDKLNPRALDLGAMPDPSSLGLSYQEPWAGSIVGPQSLALGLAGLQDLQPQLTWVWKEMSAPS